MADTMTPLQRSRCMAAIKGRDTTPEMTVRRFLFSRGLRYRVNCRRLPGSPDIVLRRYRTAIFINGCFWHGHEGCRYYRLPKTNTPFWEAKIARNRVRDDRATTELQRMGWRVIYVWECAVRDKASAAAFLETLYRSITAPDTALLPEASPVAAEPPAPYGLEE